MIRAALNRWRDRKLHKAAQLLSQYRIRRERELIRRVARDMRVDLGLPPNRPLRG